MKLFILLTICLSTPLLAADKVKVLLNPKKAEMIGALSVVIEEDQTITQQKQYLKYKLINRTKQDIFVVIDNGKNRDSVSQAITYTPDGQITGASNASAGGHYSGSPSTHQTLRLLYAPRLEDGKLTSGRDLMSAQTNCKSRVDFRSNLSKLNQSKGTLNLTVSFYATNASGFQIESFKVPVKVTFKKEPNKPVKPTNKPNKTQ